MKTSALNILILDDNTLIVDSLCKHLNERFGTRVNISTFFDADKCIRNIDEQSHVIILDYFLNDKDKGFGNGMNIFDQIKKLNPKTKAIIISANKSASSAILFSCRSYFLFKLNIRPKTRGMIYPAFFLYQ